MITTSRSLLLAAALTAAPMVAALAQSSGNPQGNLGSNKSTTAAPGTADSAPSSGLHTADPGLTRGNTRNYGAASNPAKPGATGRTVVPGSNSSQAGTTSGTSK